jgi:exosortase
LLVSTTNNLPQANAPAVARTWQGWAQFFVLLAAIWLLYHQVVGRLVTQWWWDPDYNYGFFVPALSALAAWRQSSKRKSLKPEPAWSGLLVILGALGLLVLGTLGAENYLARTSLLFLLAGLVILFRGWKFFRVLLFPWAALFLMIPLPSLVFNEIAMPLQFLASRLGASLLSLTGIPVVREGNVILLPTMSLDVAEACSGLRSLFSLLTVCVFYGFFLEKNALRRILLIAFSVPIAILANALRIAVTGMLGHYRGVDWAGGFYHLSSGILVFLFSFLALVILRRLFAWCAGLARAKVSA